MKFDKSIVKKIDNKEANKIILKDNALFIIIGGVLIILGLVGIIINMNSSAILLIFISAIVMIFIGIKDVFLKGEKKERVLTSKLVANAINEEKKKGKLLSNEDIEKIKFEYDPIFHDKIVSQVHREQDTEYESNVRKAEDDLMNLQKERDDEINRISNERWQSVGKDYLKYNVTEGKIDINQTVHPFSSIKGAEVNKEESYRIETFESAKAKKHSSVGKAIVGGALLGPLGAIAGSTMGKTTISGTSTTNSIPTCNHIGVMVDIDGFKTEIILLNSTVDQTSNTYKEALQNAEEIVSKLRYLATQPVPKKFTKVEKEKSVLEIDKSILEAEKNLEKTKAAKPTYEIPERYLSKK